MAKDHSHRRKHFTTKNPFPFADIERTDSIDNLTTKESVMLLRTKIDSDTERRTIKDSIVAVAYDVLREDIARSVTTLELYDTISDRNGDPESSQEGALSFVRSASADPAIGRDVWALYVYDRDYVLLATEEDVVYSTDIPDDATAVATSGTILQGQTQAGGLKGLTFSKFMDVMLFISNPTKTDNFAGLTTAPTGTVEHGTNLAILMTGSYNQGQIQSVDDPPSPTVPLTGVPDSYTFSNTKGYNNTINTNTLTQQDTATGFVIVTESVTSTVVVSYIEETSQYFDGSGQPSNIFDGDRGPGTSTTNSVLNGRKFAFYEGNDGSTPGDATAVRGGQTTFLSATDTGSFTIRINVPNVNAWFAIPQGKTATVLFRESSNADVTSSFDVAQLAIPTGGGTGPLVTYDLYTEKSRSAYTATANYDVTVS